MNEIPNFPYSAPIQHNGAKFNPQKTTVPKKILKQPQADVYEPSSKAKQEGGTQSREQLFLSKLCDGLKSITGAASAAKVTEPGIAAKQKGNASFPTQPITTQTPVIYGATGFHISRTPAITTTSETRNTDDKSKFISSLNFDEQVIKDLDFGTLKSKGSNEWQGLNLQYPTKNFIFNICACANKLPEVQQANNSEKNKAKLDAIKDKLGIELQGKGKNFSTFDGTFDLSKCNVSRERLDEIGAKYTTDTLAKSILSNKNAVDDGSSIPTLDEALAFFADKYFNQNSFNTNNEKLDEALNNILNEIPELINIVGKPQHSHQKYPVDLHTLSVLQQVLNAPEYDELTNQDKEILKYASLLHDTGKKPYENNPEHAKESLKQAEVILSRKVEEGKLDDDTKQKIMTIIENHHWFADYNSKKINDSDARALFDNDQNLFKLAIILSKADIYAVNDLGDANTESWYRELERFYKHSFDITDGTENIQTEDYKTFPEVIKVQTTPSSNQKGDYSVETIDIHSELGDLGLDKTKSTQRQEALSKWIKMIEDGKISELSDSQLLDIWATKKYRKLDNSECQKDYIARFNKICSEHTITPHDGQAFIRIVPVEISADDKPFSIGKEPSWPAAAARVDLSDTLPEGVLTRLVNDKMEFLNKNPQIEASGEIPTSTIFIIEKNPNEEQEMVGFDWEKTGCLTNGESSFGSGIFRKQINDKGYSTEVNFHSSSRFIRNPNKEDSVFKVKTKNGLEFQAKIIYIMPADSKSE